MLRDARAARVHARDDHADRVVGSGPFRFLPDRWVPGARAEYGRFDRYIPRQEPPDGYAGGKVVNFDRVEWSVQPDAATASAALQAGEVDWVEQPLLDLLPQLRATRGLKVQTNDPIGTTIRPSTA